MDRRRVKSRRGVYYDLTKSPYEYITPYGDLLKFSSRKKLEMYTRGIPAEIDRLKNAFDRNLLYKSLPDEVIQLILREGYKAFYRKIEVK